MDSTFRTALLLSNIRAPEETSDQGTDSNGNPCPSGRKRRSKITDEVRERQLVESDGTTYKRERDAPGQNCQYIPPGEHGNEIYRLATFSKYPSTVPIKVTDLASAGFYYTGYKDRVKCFSCGMAVENWVLGDDGVETRWHKSDCLMSRGQEKENIPLPAPNFRTLLRQFFGLFVPVYLTNQVEGKNNAAAPPRQNYEGSANLTVSSLNSPPDITDVTTNFGHVQINDNLPTLVLANIISSYHENFLKSMNLRKEVERRKTFEKWPTYPAPRLPAELAKEGFFYLGNLDRTQCFSCSGVLRNWSPQDNIREQHEKHFPHCRIVKGLATGNILMTINERRDADHADQLRLTALLPSDNLVEPADPSPEMNRHLAEHFPCNDAVNPHMRNYQSRLETFDRRWQKDRIRATPEQIAKAGFFFMGESDKTKCWYCNGGLQNWDPNDEPWTEHAKWFPGCEFVLRNKGTEFVRQLVDAHPNLNRPYIRNPVSYDIPPMNSNEPSLTMESQMRSLGIADVQSMGFTLLQIQDAIQRKLSGGGFASKRELVDYLLDENRDRNSPEGNMETSAFESIAHGSAQIPVHGVNKRIGDIYPSPSNKKLKIGYAGEEIQGESASTLQEFQETNNCRKCRIAPSDCVLIPCGHLSACSNCAPSMKRCIICNFKVESHLKVYRA